jgi:hypothetical protein
MDISLSAVIWPQFGATISMLEKALRACPDELWDGRISANRSQQPEAEAFWYVAYHTLFWLDLYLSGAVEGFTPPAPFNLDELDPAGLLPERMYSRHELLTYLEHCRRKCQATLETLTNEQFSRLCRFNWGEVSFAELLIYNLRHVQEHASQLGLFLGQVTGSAPGWVGRA